jgi:16S rRNA processing protein RimM
LNAPDHSPTSSHAGGSDEGLAPSEPLFLAVGRVLRPHGLRGEIRVEIHTDYPERFALYKEVYLAPTRPQEGLLIASEGVVYPLEGHRFHQGAVLLKLGGIDDRMQAESLRELWVWIPPKDAVPLQEGEFLLHQLMYMRVVTAEGEFLGEIAEMIETGANLVYVVRGPRGEILVPDIDEVVLDIDVEAGQMTVQLIQGLV